MKIYFIFTIMLLINISIATAKDVALERVGIYKNQSGCKTTEIVSIQETTKRLALSCSSNGMIEMLSIEDPANPFIINSFTVSNDEKISSTAIHPTKNVLAVTVINDDPFAAGTIQIHNASTGELINTLVSGTHPDSLAFSPNGKFLAVANEGEAYRYSSGGYESPEGSVTLVKFENATQATAIQVPLADYSKVEGMLHKKHARTFERFVIGGNSNQESEVNIKNNSPENVEPEFVAFSPDSSKAYISLQENNGVLIVNISTTKIEKVFGLGLTEHLADINDDGKVKFDYKLKALREPDGIAISPDGKYLLTADEGDTNPKASKTLGKKPKGGGRTLSLFDAESGKFIADTGNQLDEMAYAAGLYPDGRSDNRGSEPENVICFTIDNKLYAAVGLERANAVALVRLEDPSQPKVISIEAVDPMAGKEGEYAPEGLAYYNYNGRHYIFSANEKSGTMTVMEVKSVSEQVATH